MRLLIVGPPGSGKGTQAQRLSEKLSVVTISTGDIFRENVKNSTPLGLEAKKFMDAGDYVPDTVTNRMVRDRLAQSDVVQGFLLDGYPRTVGQVAELDDILTTSGHHLDGVLQLLVDDEELVSRLLKRAQESGRSDDTEDVIRHRLKIYHDETEPMLAQYADRGLLATVDGMGSIDDITRRLTAALETLQSR